MSYVTHSRSDTTPGRRSSFLAFSAIALFSVALASLTTLGALVTTDRYIVTEDSPVVEDQYVTSLSGIVEGRIDGDLTIFTGSLSISGEVTGSVTVFATGPVTVTESGSVGGSLRGTASSLTVHGAVGSDVFVTAASTVIEERGVVGRDLMAFGGTARVEGTVARDVRGRMLRSTIDGSVGGDVDIATQSLSVGPAASIDGDVVYRSSADADIASTATVTGTVTRLPTQGNFLYGLILSVANVVGFLGFVAVGLVGLWIVRGTSARATGLVITKPIRSLLTGVLVVILVPLVVVLLAVTLVGIPLAVVVAALALVAFILGPVPAVTALGNRILFGRGGLFGGFLLGAVLWRLGIWLIPYVGAALYVIGLVWGVGAWALGIKATREREPVPVPLLPPGIIDSSASQEGWQPPLAPGASPTGADEVELPRRWREPADADEGSVDEPTPEEGEGPDPYRERDTTHASEPVMFGDAGADTEADVQVDEEMGGQADGIGTGDEPEVTEPEMVSEAPKDELISFGDGSPAGRTEAAESEAEADEPTDEPEPHVDEPEPHDEGPEPRPAEVSPPSDHEEIAEQKPVAEMTLEERLAAFREELAAIEDEGDRDRGSEA